MTANEEKVLKTIKDSKGKASSLQIARELKISSGYADLILKALQRKEKIEISGRWVALSKKELAKAANPSRKRAQPPKKPKVKRKKVERLFSDLKTITEKSKKILLKAGYKDKQVIAEAPLSRLMENTGLELKQAANLINEARGNFKTVNADVTESNLSEESPELESSSQGLDVPSPDPKNLPKNLPESLPENLKESGEEINHG